MLKTGRTKKVNDTKFVPLFSPHDTIQAGLIREALEHADLICYVNNENLSSIRMGGGGIGVGTMTVMIPDNQAEQAIRILKDLRFE